MALQLAFKDGGGMFDPHPVPISHSLTYILTAYSDASDRWERL